jgi:hypothetical protein
MLHLPFLDGECDITLMISFDLYSANSNNIEKKKIPNFEHLNGIFICLEKEVIVLYRILISK